MTQPSANQTFIAATWVWRQLVHWRQRCPSVIRRPYTLSLVCYESTIMAGQQRNV